VRAPLLTSTITALVLTATALLVTGCGGSEGRAYGVDLSGKAFVDETAASQVEVEALDNTFTPAYIEIRPGTSVTFDNGGRNPHNVLPVDEGAFAPIDTEAFDPRERASITFDEVGDYPYYCSLHGTTTKGKVGAVRVVG
jgi:plastocyanin